jgi:predicted DCC family thiol-disulfide oxidoreductase YuxK
MNENTWLYDLEARLDERFEQGRVPRSLTVLFDPTCALCRRCRDWMLRQPTYLELRFEPCTAERAREAYPGIPWAGTELVVLGDAGEVWVGPAAFLLCLWALRDYREWSFRLSGTAFAPLAERFFLLLSAKRRSISALFEHDCSDGACRRK